MTLEIVLKLLLKSLMNNKFWEIPDYQIIELNNKSRSKYCVCIPVINEGIKIVNEIKKIKKYTKKIDVIICDGGSTDNSLEKEFLKRNNIKTLLIKKDEGKLSAQLRMGYSYSLNKGYKGIITIDGNGKDEVSDILSFIPKLDEGFDYVQGSRFIKGGRAINTPLLRLFAIKFIHSPIISFVARKFLTDTTNGFRAYSRRYLLDSKVKPFRKIFINYELLAYLSARASQIGFRVAEIPVSRIYPKDGKIPTKISFFKGNIDIFMTLIKLLFGYYNP